jgi:CRISPR system Cascade subunit CasA
MTMVHSLISDALISWRDAQRHRHRATLPGILAKLASGELADFPRVRAHQLDPWCMFLTQLAAIALHRASRTDPRLTEEEWRSLLLGLTEGAHEPWCLVVADLTKSAFFQPSEPGGTVEQWSSCEHPDDIDILVTSKGHDVKASLLGGDDIEGWIHALVTLQTMQGYAGGSGGYNRVARMKGGYGSRPRVGLAADRGLSTRFTRDLQVLADLWEPLINRGFTNDGLALVWTAPWDGKSSLSITQLSPHFIEVCWRVRCQALTGKVVCRYTTTESRRCLPEIENGDAGDAWIPIERQKGALTVGRSGFHYELLTRFLFDGEYEPAAAQVMRAEDGDPVVFLASVMSHGKGKTEGLHERALFLSGPGRKQMGRSDTRSVVGKRASQRVEQAKKMRGKVLFPALRKIALGEKTVEDEFDSRIDAFFFDDLFATIEQGDDVARLVWDQRLHETAWMELQRAIGRCCVPAGRWYQAVSDAEAMFRFGIRKHFPTLMASIEDKAMQGAPS